MSGDEKKKKATDEDLEKLYKKMNEKNDETSMRGVKMKLSKFKMSKLKSTSDEGNPLSNDEKEALNNGVIKIGASRARFSLPSTKGQKLKTIGPKFKSSGTSLPADWNNYTAPANDPDNIKYKLSTRPMNQQRCGSCFACACANTISDVFVFGFKQDGKQLNYNPDISPMVVMSCIPDTDGNAKCDGGNPIQVFASLSKNGVTSNRCIDYNSLCNASDHCKNDGEATPSDMKIPECGGCYTKACNKPVKRNKYFIKKPTYVSITDGYDEESNEVPGNPSGVQIIKEHLYKFGSAVSGYPVFKNFMNDASNGEFKDTYGVYIESEFYGLKPEESEEFLGCHAIVVVGWGIENRPIKLRSGAVLQNTPYWVVRNTWGTVWGLGGYFKIAMYQEPSKENGNAQINPNTALERFKFYNPPDGGTIPVGGIILVEPDKIEAFTEPPRTVEALPEDIIKYYCSDVPTLEIVDSMKEKEKNEKEKNEKEKDDKEKDEKEKDEKKKKKNSNNSKLSAKKKKSDGNGKIFIMIAVVAIVISVGGYFLYKYNKNKK